MTVRVVIHSAAVVILAAALAGVCSPAAAEKHNVLERFPSPSSVRVALASAGSHAIHIRYNTSKLHGSGQWVRVIGGQGGRVGHTEHAASRAKLCCLTNPCAHVHRPLPSPGCAFP